MRWPPKADRVLMPRTGESDKMAFIEEDLYDDYRDTLYDESG